MNRSAVPRPIGLKIKYVMNIPYSEMPTSTDCPILPLTFYETAYIARSNMYLAFWGESDVLRSRLCMDLHKNLNLRYTNGCEPRSDIDLERTHHVPAVFALEWPRKRGLIEK